MGRNEGSFFSLQIFAVCVCNNQKQHFRGRVQILVCAESHREKVLLVLCPPPEMVGRVLKVDLGHWLPLTVFFTTSNSQKGPHCFSFCALFSSVLSLFPHLLSLPSPLPAKDLTSPLSRHFGITVQNNVFHLLLPHLIANCRNTHWCLLL